MFAGLSVLNILLVAFGGALGAVLRYLVSVVSINIQNADFPYGTFIVNLIGSFLIGLAAAILVSDTSNSTKLFLITGVLGGFTTYSAFSLDFVSLWSRGDFMIAFAYAFATNLLAISFAFIGLWFGKQFV